MAEVSGGGLENCNVAGQSLNFRGTKSRSNCRLVTLRCEAASNKLRSVGDSGCQAVVVKRWYCDEKIFLAKPR